MVHYNCVGGNLTDVEADGADLLPFKIEYSMAENLREHTNTILNTEWKYKSIKPIILNRYGSEA